MITGTHQKEDHSDGVGHASRSSHATEVAGGAAGGAQGHRHPAEPARRDGAAGAAARPKANPDGDFASATPQTSEVRKAGTPGKTETHPEIDREQHVLTVDDFDLFYGKRQALFKVDMKIAAGKVTALVGPSGCGKSTLLRSMNRLNDLVDGVRVEGNMRFRGRPIYDRATDVIGLRRRLGMVFQKPNPFPMSIFDNVVYGLRIAGEKRRRVLDEVCERSLRSAALWDEVKDRIHTSALGLSGGQQQRLCIARAIAADPEVLLMDEPCSALDPIATGKIEDLIYELRGKYTVVIVTHNMQQAARVSDFTAFMYLGRLIEYGPTSQIFGNPRLKQTEDYVTGRFG